MSLPHVSSLYENHSHFDLDPQELLDICVSCVAAEIQQWQPADSPSEQDYLHHRLDDRAKRKVETAITGCYGLKHNQYPILDFYFQAQAQFQQHHCSQVAGKARHPLETEPDYDASFLPDSLAAAMANLNGTERVILFAHFGQNLTQREIAGRLGITEARVYQTLQRALKKLRHPANARLLRDWLS